MRSGSVVSQDMMTGEEMAEMKRRVPRGEVCLCFGLLLLLQLPVPSTAQTFGSLLQNITVRVGQPAVFYCDYPMSSYITFSFSGAIGNYTLNCSSSGTNNGLTSPTVRPPLSGACQPASPGRNQAVWTMGVTTNSDDWSRLTCSSPGLPPVRAVLRVQDKSSVATMLACVLGGFFGVLVLIVLAYLAVKRSPRLQRIFRGDDADKDDISIVTKD